MRTITKEITIILDGKPVRFRITKLDAFSGASLLRHLMRLQEKGAGITILDLYMSLSQDELRAVMTSCLNNVEVILPAGPNPVMTGPEWGYPELEHDPQTCMKLVIESLAWTLQGFFSDGGRTSPPETQAISP